METSIIQNFKNLFLEILSEEEIFEGKLAPVSLEGDEVDIVTTEKANQMDFRLKTRNAIYLKKVRRALHKIDEGKFGECDDCGCEISHSRLLARPVADFCIVCKEAEEREESQTLNKNRNSSKSGNVLPIEVLMKGYKGDETGTTSHAAGTRAVSHMSYQDIVG